MGNPPKSRSLWYQNNAGPERVNVKPGTLITMHEGMLKSQFGPMTAGPIKMVIIFCPSIYWLSFRKIS